MLRSLVPELEKNVQGILVEHEEDADSSDAEEK